MTGNVPSQFPLTNLIRTGPPQPIEAPPSSVSLKGPVIMDQRPSWPSWQVGLNAFPLLPFPLRFLSPCASFRQFLLLASPPSIPLPAYVYVLGVPPTQTGTMMPVLLQSYRRAFNSYCDYGSKVMTVNATVYAAPRASSR